MRQKELHGCKITGKRSRTKSVRGSAIWPVRLQFAAYLMISYSKQPIHSNGPFDLSSYVSATQLQSHLISLVQLSANPLL